MILSSKLGCSPPTLDTWLLAIDLWQTGRTVQPASKQALLAKINEPLLVLEEPLLTWAKQLQPRYFKLAYLLQQGMWGEADNTTYNVMKDLRDRGHKGYLDIFAIQKFSCQDLKIIDQLWEKYSQGKFGFSIQKQIYVETGNPLDGEYHEETWEKFADRVGWFKNGSYLGYRAPRKISEISIS